MCLRHLGTVLIQQADLTVQKVHEFVHGTALTPAARVAMETAMRSLSRPEAAELIAQAIISE